MSLSGPYTGRIAALAGIVVTMLFCAAMPGPAGAAGKSEAPGAPDGGVRVIAQESGGEFSAMCVFVGVGPAYEKDGERGISGLLNELVLASVPGRPGGRSGAQGGESLSVSVERLGGRVAADTYPGYSCFTLAVPADNFRAALKLLGAALSSPSVTGSTLAMARRAAGAKRRMTKDRPFDFAYGLFLDRTYPDSPYGSGPDGDGSGLTGVGAADVKGWHETFYRADNVLVSYCGGVQGPELAGMVKEAFGGLPVSGARALPGPGSAARPVATSGRSDVKWQVDGAAALLGYTAPVPGSPDYPAVRLLEALVARGMTSMLFKRLREEDVLAYTFGGVLPPGGDVTRLVFYAGTDKEKIDAAADKIKGAVESVRKGDFSESELRAAKEKAAGSVLMEGEGSVGAAWLAGFYEMNGAGALYQDELAALVGRLGKDDVVRAARKYLDKYTLVVLKPGPAPR